MRNFVKDGDIIDLLNSSGSTISAGGVVVEGYLTGIACADIANGARGACKMKGVFDLSVTDTGGGITVGAPIRVTLATGVLSDAAYNAGVVHHFGYALEAVGAGLTATINVLKSAPGNPVE